MNILERFPYLSKCCLCINLRTGCILVGFVSIIFHLTFVIIRDITVLVSVKKASEQRPHDTCKYIFVCLKCFFIVLCEFKFCNFVAYTILLILLVQTICVRLPGVLCSCCTVAGALMVWITYLLKKIVYRYDTLPLHFRIS